MYLLVSTLLALFLGILVFKGVGLLQLFLGNFADPQLGVPDDSIVISSGLGTSSAAAVELSEMLKEIFDVDERRGVLLVKQDVPCVALEEAIEEIIEKSDKLSARTLIELLKCKVNESSLQRIFQHFRQWSVLKDQNSAAYEEVLSRLKIEELSSDALSCFEGEDLLAKWPYDVPQAPFCAKLKNPNGLFDALTEAEHGKWIQVLRRPCVHALMKHSALLTLSFLLEDIPVTGLATESEFFNWHLLLEAILHDLINEADLKRIDLAISILKAFQKRSIETIISTELKETVKQILIYGRKKNFHDAPNPMQSLGSFINSILATQPNGPNSPLSLRNYQFYSQVKETYSWKTLLTEVPEFDVLVHKHGLDWEQRIELAWAMGRSEAEQIELFSAGPEQLEDFYFARWFQMAIKTERHELASFLLKKYGDEKSLEVFCVSSKNLKSLLVELAEFPEHTSKLLTCLRLLDLQVEVAIAMPFLAVGVQLENFSSAELTCLEAKSIEGLEQACSNEAFRKHCSAQFDELLEAARTKKDNNEKIEDFVSAALLQILPKVLNKRATLCVHFLDQAAEDQGGLARHFISLMLGFLADSRLGCLMPSSKSDSLCFASFLEPKWAAVIGFLQAQALFYNVSPGFVLEFDEPCSREVENELFTSKLPNLNWLAKNLNCPPHKKFILGQTMPKELAEGVQISYFVQLASLEQMIREECRKEYWNGFCRVFDMEADAALQDSLQSLMHFCSNATPNLEALMRVFHFETATTLLVDGKAFPVAFKEICQELSAEWDGFIGAFLLFVRGSSMLPASGINSLRITVEAVLDDKAKDEKSLRLPTASTCIESIRFDIPANCSKEALKQKLKYALEHGKEYCFI